MSKKQTTIYLQGDIHSYLVNYKEKNGLSNLSIAIERLILERIFNEQGNLNINPNISIKSKDKSNETKATKLLNNIKNTMPE